MIKAIIFDLGNVIVNVDETNLYHKWAEGSGKNFGYVTDYYENSATRKDFEKGKFTPGEFYNKVVEEINLKMNFSEFKKAYCDIFTLNNDVANLIRKLKKNFRLILLSNTDILHFECIKKKYKIINEFDDYVLSYKVHCRKPNPLIFMYAIKKSKALPFNCAYIDDIGEFIYVAKLMGIKAFQYMNFRKLKQDLSNAKVL